MGSNVDKAARGHEKNDRSTAGVRTQKTVPGRPKTGRGHNKLPNVYQREGGSDLGWVALSLGGWLSARPPPPHLYKQSLLASRMGVAVTVGPSPARPASVSGPVGATSNSRTLAHRLPGPTARPRTRRSPST